jgi:UDP-N-acetylglucosamine acyltransferase
VQDRAFISGNVVVHQFSRIGTLAILQGGMRVTKDVPPYVMAHTLNLMSGLNIVGLRRAGLTQAERTELKLIYRLLFRSGKNLRAAVAEAQKQFTSTPARNFLDFVATTKRGVANDSSGASMDTEEE